MPLRDQIPSCLENSAAAINASGLVAGTYCYSYLHPFTWRFGGRYLDLGVGDDVANANGLAAAINDAGTVAGYLNLHSNVGSNAAIWRKGMGYTLLPDLLAPVPQRRGVRHQQPRGGGPPSPPPARSSCTARMLRAHRG